MSVKMFLVLGILILVLNTNAASSSSARWVKLNCRPVCYGAKDDSFGVFLVDRQLVAHQIKLVRVSGKVSCAPNYYGYFSCSYHTVKNYVTVHLTDSKNNVIVPAAPVQYASEHKGWYWLNGNKATAATVVMSTGSIPFTFKKGDIYRLWYGEDLYAYAEADNSGQACADVYAMV